jgi:hypothetical protein
MKARRKEIKTQYKEMKTALLSDNLTISICYHRI